MHADLCSAKSRENESVLCCTRTAFVANKLRHFHRRPLWRVISCELARRGVRRGAAEDSSSDGSSAHGRGNAVGLTLLLH